jgi:hypothetical protein
MDSNTKLLGVLMFEYLGFYGFNNIIITIVLTWELFLFIFDIGFRD